MKKLVFTGLCFLQSVLAASAALQIRSLTCEHVAAPLGIETAQPRFSWKLDSGENGQFQTAYQIVAADSPEQLTGDKGNLWDSGWVVSPSCRLISYAGSPLISLQNCWWKVRVKDRSGKISDWSSPTHFATGLLAGEVPAGQWISNPSADFKTGTSWFRKTVQLKTAPRQALVLLASRGYHEFYVNGKKVGDRALAPNASMMEKRTLYVVYDIASLLQEGENTLAVWISPGRVATGRVDPTFLLCGKIDGQAVTSDATWKTKTANLVRYYSTNPNNPKEKPGKGGEQWDDRAFISDWNTAGFNDSSWASAAVRQEKTAVSSDIIPPTRQVETITAKKIERRPDGTVLVDFGGYCTGRLEARVQGEPGKPVKFAALADLKTPVYFGQYSEVIPGDTGTAVFQHHFNWMCGRWLEVSGLTGTPELSDFKVHRISMDLNRIGFFKSSDDLLNRLYEADLYTYRNVTLDGYTHDCTTRERRGYGEEAFGTSRDMAVTYDLTAFTRKWLRDWRDAQSASNGFIPHTAPEGMGGGGTLWSSFTVLAPWNLYVQSGDRQILEENQDSARRWMKYLQGTVTNQILSRYENKVRFDFLGDWARPIAPEDRGHDKHIANFGDSPLALAFNNGIYAMDLQTMSRVSAALGKQEDVSEWNNRLSALQPAVHEKFFRPETGVYIEPNQVFGMLMQLTGITPLADLDKVRAALDAELKSKNYIDAGSSGLPIFTEFIIQHPEYHQWFYDVLQRRDYPGFAYFLDQGYDNWPELWDPTCSSKIHSCYIGLSAFCVRTLAGIEPLADAPGYEKFIVKPSFVKGLDRVSYEFDSPRGWIKVKWERKGGEIVLDLTVPPGSSAEVHLPSGIQAADSGTHQYRIVLGKTPGK